MTTNSPAPAVAPRLVAALDRMWAAIRARHPEVPEVVITLGSGSIGAPAGKITLGHFAANRWQRGEGRLPEMFVAGEGLSRGAAAVLGTLLHEAAHGLANVRGTQDTSRQGRYHNARYRDLAAEMGLEVSKVEGIGWSGTKVTDATAAAYEAELGELSAAIVAWRHSERSAALAGDDDGEGEGGRASNNNGLAARCECGRRIRVSLSVYEAGPIVCGLCGGAFLGDDPADDPADDD